ncbi:uncharacterized protein LOC144112604 [Amblyomma americanum]
MADHNFGLFPGQSPPDEKRLFNHSVPSTSTSLNTHRDKPTGKQIYQCTHCGNIFKKRSYLVEHIRTHTGDRPYHCSDCDSTFAYKNSLVRHLRTHTSDRPYRCDHCDRKFSVKSSLDNHLRTHTGDRPYRCDHCDSAYVQKSHLVDHVRIHTAPKGISGNSTKAADEPASQPPTVDCPRFANETSGNGACPTEPEDVEAKEPSEDIHEKSGARVTSVTPPVTTTAKRPHDQTSPEGDKVVAPGVEEPPAKTAQSRRPKLRPRPNLSDDKRAGGKVLHEQADVLPPDDTGGHSGV